MFVIGGLSADPLRPHETEGSLRLRPVQIDGPRWPPVPCLGGDRRARLCHRGAGQRDEARASSSAAWFERLLRQASVALARGRGLAVSGASALKACPGLGDSSGLGRPGGCRLPGMARPNTSPAPRPAAAITKAAAGRSSADTWPTSSGPSEEPPSPISRHTPRTARRPGASVIIEPGPRPLPRPINEATASSTPWLAPGSAPAHRWMTKLGTMAARPGGPSAAGGVEQRHVDGRRRLRSGRWRTTSRPSTSAA